jgi:hypothetical protein
MLIMDEMLVAVVVAILVLVRAGIDDFFIVECSTSRNNAVVLAEQEHRRHAHCHQLVGLN